MFSHRAVVAVALLVGKDDTDGRFGKGTGRCKRLEVGTERSQCFGGWRTEQSDNQ